MSILKKQIDQVQKQSTAQALKELEKENCSWSMSHDLEEGEVKDKNFIGEYNSKAES